MKSSLDVRCIMSNVTCFMYVEWNIFDLKIKCKIVNTNQGYVITSNVEM